MDPARNGFCTGSQPWETGSQHFARATTGGIGGLTGPTATGQPYMHRTSLWILALALTTSRLAVAGTDSAEVRKVMDTFHRAVVNHDGAQVAALFIPEGSTWLNVLTDEAYARAKAKTPGVTKIHVGSYKEFANFVSNSKVNLEPRHAHVKIFSDGTIAVAYFDFEFMIDGKIENRGSETWQLVKGPDGWRIAAITYSSDPRSHAQ